MRQIERMSADGCELPPLDAARLGKAKTYQRALRRVVLSYWYATVEDHEAAAIEASMATLVVNILDEAVFLASLGVAYRRVRAQARLGRVVMGLELVRNCETHSPLAYGDLLIERIQFGVPRSTGTAIRRSVYAWAHLDDLPSEYRDLPAGATASQSRARAEAQDGYRKAVQGRSVIETLFDALAFFQSVEPRLAAPDPPAVRWAYAEGLCDLPRGDPLEGEHEAVFIARPLGLDLFETSLPDIACRHFERRMARWPAADGWLAEEARRARRAPPDGGRREVRHRLLSEGRLVGYSGVTSIGPVHVTWVERAAQVWRDVRGGYPYFIHLGNNEIALAESRHGSVVAIDDGLDALDHLTKPTEWALGFERLQMLEDYPDLYLDMRRHL